MDIERRSILRVGLALSGALMLGLQSASLSAQEIKGLELTLVDLDGKKQVLTTLPGTVYAPRLSPDGQRVAFDMFDPPPASGGPPTVQRVYVAELNALDKRRALPMVGKGRNWAPVWFPDGERIAFLVSGESPDALWWTRADGTGEAQKLIDGRAPEGVTSDGKRLAFITRTDKGDYGVSLLDIASKTVTLFADRPDSDQHSSRISPDGRWIAYSSSETGRQEVWVEPLPQTGQRYRMTQTGGRHPLWAPDGKTLYFDQSDQMFALPVTLAADQPKAGDPRGLPIKGFVQGEFRRQFDLSPDGKRFVMLFPAR